MEAGYRENKAIRKTPVKMSGSNSTTRAISPRKAEMQIEALKGGFE